MSSYMYYQPFVSGHHHSDSVNGGVAVMTGYGYPQMNPNVLAPPQQSSSGVFQPGHGHANSFVLPPPGLSYLPPPPPPGMQGHHMMVSAPQAMLPPPTPAAQQQDQSVNGGVCEVLDYELNVMAEFVAKNACLSFGSFDIPSDVMELFSSSVSSVLASTRLPSVTIFLALDYLIKYLDLIECDFQSIGGKSVDVIYQNLVVAFVLANKFNDDKTFTNNSWSQATGMELKTINDFERKWLAVFEWKLFEDQFDTYESFLESYNAFVREQKLSAYQQQFAQSPAPTHQRQYSSASPVAYGYQTPSNSNTSMAYSSPVYSDLRSDSNNSLYNKQFFSANPQISPMPKAYGAPVYYEHPHQTFWNEPQQAQYNPNYYCFSAAY